jgi:protein-L-isoaspartate(D-aspartate) O-methyltransferase
MTHPTSNIDTPKRAVDSSEARGRYASQVRHKAALRSERLIEALGTVARKDFLGPPPWRITRPPDLWKREFTSDLAQIYDDVVVALDPARNLNNGLPSALTALIDALELKESQTVLHAEPGPGITRRSSRTAWAKLAAWSGSNSIPSWRRERARV